MTIEFFNDRIKFTNYSLYVDSAGVKVRNHTDNSAGKLYATDYQYEGTYQGTVAGYVSGASPSYTGIEKFPFASDTNATNVGSLYISTSSAAGQSSDVSGYVSMGYQPAAVSPRYTNQIQKFLFGAGTNATDVGDLTQGGYQGSGNSSAVEGYVSNREVGPGMSNVIDKFPFAADTNASDVGDLTQAKYGATGQNSTQYGYVSAGYVPTLSPVNINVIERFPFASKGNASDVGDLTRVGFRVIGQSSTVSGYTSGGEAQPAIYSNVIDKFPFATTTNATDVGDLTQARSYVAGNSSTNHGYVSGGWNGSVLDTIDKFPFAADGNAFDVGNLSSPAAFTAGQND